MPWPNAMPYGGEPAQTANGAFLGAGFQRLLAQLQAPKPSVVPSSASLQLGPCFLCGKPGHYRKSWPLLQAFTSHKATHNDILTVVSVSFGRLDSVLVMILIM